MVLGICLFALLMIATIAIVYLIVIMFTYQSSDDYDTPLYRSVSHLSSDKDDELERQKRKDELEQLEQTLEKNCPGYIRISRYYGL